MKKSLLTAILLLAITTICAQGPNNSGTYYQGANGLKGKALKTKLSSIISSGINVISYSGLYDAYKKTDTRSDNYVRDWYSNTTSYVPGSNCAGSFEKEGDGYNREHLVPQSWFSKRDPMRSDIFFFFFTDAKINNMRGNYPLGEVGTVIEASKNNYSKKKYRLVNF